MVRDAAVHYSEIMLITDPFRSDEDVMLRWMPRTAQSRPAWRSSTDANSRLARGSARLSQCNHLAPKDILQDSVHPNARGLEVMQGSAAPFRINPLGQTTGSHPCAPTKQAAARRRLRRCVMFTENVAIHCRSAVARAGERFETVFTGNRVDCVWVWSTA